MCVGGRGEPGALLLKMGGQRQSRVANSEGQVTPAKATTGQQANRCARFRAGRLRPTHRNPTDSS